MNTSNTALQELIKIIDKRIELFNDDLLPSGRAAYDAYLNCKNESVKLLQMEIGQIKQAYNAGWHNCHTGKFDGSEKYLNNTFNQIK